MSECNHEMLTRKEFLIERDRIYETLMDHGQKIAVLTSLCTNMSDLPNTIQNLDKTMALMQQNLENLNDKFDKLQEDNNKRDAAQSKEIQELDEKSKLDIVKWIRDNWFKVVFGFAMLALVYKNYAG